MLWTPPDEIFRTLQCINDLTSLGTKEICSLCFSISSELPGIASSSYVSSYLTASGSSCATSSTRGFSPSASAYRGELDFKLEDSK